MDDHYKEQAYQLARIGHWELDVADKQLYWSEQVKRLHEVSLDYQPDLESALDFYEKGYHRNVVEKAVAKAIEEGRSFSFESKITTDKGNSCWVRVVGEPVMQYDRCVRLYGSTQDITDRKTMEQQMQQERDRISEAEQEKTRMLERIDDGFFAVDDDWIVRYWNKRAEKILGVAKDEVMGYNLWEVFREAHELDFHDEYHKALNEQVTVHFVEHFDPQDKWLEVTAYPCEIGLSVYFRDFTEEMHSKRDLLEKQKQLQNIADNITGCILRYRLHPDNSDELVYVSKGIEELFEITPQEAMGSTEVLWSQLSDGHYKKVRGAIEASAENLTSWDQTFKIETPSGRQKWIHGRGTPQRLEDGSVQWDMTEQDISKQKQLEKEVKRQVTLLNHILDSLPGLFFMANEDLMFARINRHGEELFGQPAEDLQDTNILEFVLPSKKAEAKQAIQKIYTDGYAEHETILLDAVGEEHHYYISGTYFESKGKRYILGNGLDITDRVEAEEENRVLLQEVHHRVKNNLAIISGILGLELDELSVDSINRLPLERSVNRIQAIAKVHEMLYKSTSLSQINVRKYISELVTTVTNTLQGEEEIDIRLEVDDIEMNINEIIPLGMLLNELLTNSLKYAFKEQENGVIILDITKNQQAYKVKYLDNGRGFDRSDFEDSASLGFTIVNLLLQQLRADYDLETKDGFEISFNFGSRERGAHSNL
ncbi:PAS domain S-box protein [Gracilimonas sp. Q87]|uniref:PAS domain-containing sensor histidine kinase n=1 Tax=Gracilimonas sp. Q87 TaxID=3384766 RepID=UPI003984132F